jgi:ACS family hexuronate transporter-like MFS transporter
VDKTIKYSYRAIVILLLLATAQSFMDRQVLSVSILVIREDLNISDVQYGFINAAFLVSYAIMFTIGGILIDRYGSRLGLAVSVGVWSFASLLHAISGSAFHFGFFRFLLGVGEGGAFPGAVKAVSEYVPKKKQAFANGIAIGGAAFGAVIAPPLTVFLLSETSWRAVFIFCGVTGFIWMIGWFKYAKKLPSLNAKDINIGLSFKSENQGLGIKKLLSEKAVFIFIIIRFILDPIFYFYMFWIPAYLSDVHGLSLNLIGNILWIPFMALGIANIFGGWISDYVYNKTGNLDFSRKIIMGIAALLTIPLIFTGTINSYIVILILMVLAFFAHGLWITNYITAIGDIYGKYNTSSIVGFSGTAGAVSSMIINPLTGLIVSTWSYNPLWIYAGIMYPVAFIILLFFIPKIKPMSLGK